MTRKVIGIKPDGTPIFDNPTDSESNLSDQNQSISNQINQTESNPIFQTESKSENDTSRFDSTNRDSIQSEFHKDSMKSDETRRDSMKLDGMGRGKSESNKSVNIEIPNTQKSEILEKMKVILANHGGIESNIPIGSEYWSLRSLYNTLK